MSWDAVDILREHGVNPSAQRVAVANYVLRTDQHPSADDVWTRVRKKFPQISRATVYNTLNLFVAVGLLKQFAFTEGRLVFDPGVDRHHHFIDEVTGKIYDIPWSALKICNVAKLDEFDVSDYQVVLRGRKARSKT